MIYKVLLKNEPDKSKTDIYHFLGEKLLAYGLYLEKGITYSEEALVLNSWGKPSLRNYPKVHYNISHSKGIIACVISEQYSVGIDVERVRSFNTYAANKVCSPEELKRIYSIRDSNREFFRYWTLKESYIKALGKGISHPMKKVNFDIRSSGEIYSNISDCSFLLIEDKENYITAVCYKKILVRE